MRILKMLMVVTIITTVTFSCKRTDDDFPTGTTAQSDRVELYATSNTTGNITVYDVKEIENVTFNTHTTGSSDTEGLSYNIATDELTFTSRSAGTLSTVEAISQIEASAPYVPSILSASVLVSPRDVTARAGFYVVSDNSDVDGDPMTDDGRFFIFERSGESYILRNTVTVDFAVWGIQFVGSSLVAVVDKTSDIAIFNSFTANNQTDDVAIPSKRITIAGLTRTHGIGFNGSAVVLTDIGDASNDIDGGFHVIDNFTAVLENIDTGGTLSLENQVRVAGPSTQLGNPVSAAYDGTTNTVYIAERANTSGRILAFRDIPTTGGDVAPTYSSQLAGASSVLLYRGN
ncbi:MAG: hypothetical protein HKM28_00605 [Flavobacteriaceae bacterium]|nr:hypothetical protein [Flavobacteriaceae bacterium]